MSPDVLHLRVRVFVLLTAMLLVAGCDRQPPPTVDELLHDAGRQLQRNEHQAALELVARAEVQDPQSPRPLLTRGSILLAAGKAGDAAVAYDTAVDLALVQRQRRLDAAQERLRDDAPDAEAVADLRKQAGDALESAARAAFGAVLAEPTDEAAADRATQLWEQRLDELASHSNASDQDLRNARLHLALINALRGNTTAARSQLDMLAAHHRDYTLVPYWKQRIANNDLRATLIETAAAGGE